MPPDRFPSWLTVPALALPLALLGCSPPPPDAAGEARGPVSAGLDGAAERYVKLVLAAGRHDPDLVDAYFGPPAWKEEAGTGEPLALADLSSRAAALRSEVLAAPASERRRFLDVQLTALAARLRMLAGERLPLPEEARLLYGIEPPPPMGPQLEEARAGLDALLPGPGPLHARVEAFRSRFHVPSGRLDDLIRLTLVELRGRTEAAIPLPRGEAVAIRPVVGKPWGAYCWYQGGLRSLLEISTDLPVEMASIFHIVAHEGYPGHHTTNVVLESEMVRGRGRVELAVQPLWCPQALLMEGTANAGLDALMTRDEQEAFLRDVLAPAAGLAAENLDLYRRVRETAEPLRHVQGEAARMLLEEGRPEAEVLRFLVETGLRTDEKARRAIDFIRRYRAYAYTYTVGEDLVRAHVGTGPDRARRFSDLLRSPILPER